MSPVRIVVAVTIAALVFTVTAAYIAWIVLSSISNGSAWGELRPQSDPCLTALLRTEQGRAGVQLAELGVAALIANCNGRRAWHGQDRYSVPLTAEDGHPDGFRMGMTESTQGKTGDEAWRFGRRQK